LPNDPRGSWSEFVGSWDLFRYGSATKVSTRRSVAARPHDTRQRRTAKSSLKYPPVVLNTAQAAVVGTAFGKYSQRNAVDVWACAILPDHVHLIVGRHELPVEQLVIQLKSAGSRELIAARLHPLATYAVGQHRPPKAFSRGEWKVFLDRDDDIRRAIRYVEQNPIKEGYPRQRWPFITPHCLAATRMGAPRP
jgi:REP element-mobilizing transposase RayT